jgi:ribosomal protein S18 acetylase RimI-like enzyme
MTIEIREAKPEEYAAIGQLTVQVYQQLPGMPGTDAMPDYYKMLANVAGRLIDPSVKVIVASTLDSNVLGTVTYYGNMEYYGSGGSAPKEKQASGIRLLAVDMQARGQGLGRKLTEYCIHLAQQSDQQQVILHTTKAMLQAWELYERMGFKPSPDLDFLQGPLPVFGFRRKLSA